MLLGTQPKMWMLHHKKCIRIVRATFLFIVVQTSQMSNNNKIDNLYIQYTVQDNSNKNELDQQTIHRNMQKQNRKYVQYDSIQKQVKIKYYLQMHM